MDQTFRLCVLIACCLILFHCYQFIYLLTETPAYCWELHEFWLEGGFSASPFWMFSVIFGLLALWVIVEVWVLLVSGTMAAHSIAALASALPVILGLGVMQFVMWQSLQIKAGSLSAADAWLPHYDKALLYRMQEFRQRRQKARDQWHADYPGVPFDFDEFIAAYSCDKGIERTNLTPGQWEQLGKDFGDIRYRHYRELERQEPTSNRAVQRGMNDQE